MTVSSVVSQDPQSVQCGYAPLNHLANVLIAALVDGESKSLRGAFEEGLKALTRPRWLIQRCQHVAADAFNEGSR